MIVPRPFLKWVGGKTQLLPELLARVPAKFCTYREPFLGGGALFWAIAGCCRGGAVLSDANSELVAAYRGVRDKVERVIVALEQLDRTHSPETFATVRSENIDGAPDCQVAARMIYLNKTCFNGLYRVNKSGKFNVPLGKYVKKPTICDKDNLRACSQTLRTVNVVCVDFKEALLLSRAGDFAYLDPPYVPSSETADFTGYTAGDFGLDDQKKLADCAKCLKRDGIYVLLSNSGTQVVRDLYEDGFTIEQVSARRNINCDPGKKGAVTEFLIS